jgi:hypothetical protein
MIKKLTFIFLVNLMASNLSLAYELKERPDWSVDDLQSNIKDYGFRIVGTNIASNDNFPVEIITLEKKGWILKCKIKYASQIYTYCDFP